MKKLTILLVAAAMVLGTAVCSLAVEVDNYGYFRAYTQWVDNHQFQDDASGGVANIGDDGRDFVASSRLRAYWDFVASENLKATLGLEFDTSWGFPNQGTERDREGDPGMDTATNTELKRSMLEFTWPGTDMTITAGAQGFSMPSGAYGSPVAATDITGAIVSSPLSDMASLTVGWLRPMAGGIGSDGNMDADAAFLSLPVNMDGFSFNPYFMYAWIGQDTNANWAQARMNSLAATNFTDSANAWWLGSTLNVTMMDPLLFTGHFVYGSVSADQDVNDREGWWLDLALDYKMDMMTPTVYFLYTSGDDDDLSDGSETFPTLAQDGYCATPSSVAFGFRCTYGFSDPNYSLAQLQPNGIWEIGVGLKDIKLMDRLTHSFGISYGQGTHDEELGQILTNQGIRNAPYWVDFNEIRLTDEDSFIQARLDNTYQIYENLAIVSEIGYASLDMDDSTWQGQAAAGNDYLDDDAWLFNFGFNYSF